MKFNIMSKLLTGFLSIAAIILITGIINLTLTMNLKQKSHKAGIVNFPLINAVMKIKQNTMNAHLLFEEIYYEGNKHSIDDVWKLLDDAVSYTDIMLEGGDKQGKRFYKIENPELITNIKSVKQIIINFKKTAKNRYDNINTVSTGSEIDQEFDKQYSYILNSITKTASLVNASSGSKLNDIKYNIANAHLYLEEYLSGDTEVNPDEILAEFNTAGKKYRAVSYNLPGNSRLLINNINKLIITAEQRIKTYSINQNNLNSTEKDFNASYDNFLSEINNAQLLLQSMIDSDLSTLRKTTNINILLLITAILSSTSLALFIGIFLSLKISNPIKKLTQAGEKIADGNLEIENLDLKNNDETGTLINIFNKIIKTLKYKQNIIKTIALGTGDFSLKVELASDRDELGRDIQHMLKTLNQMIFQVKKSIENINSGASQISSSSQDLSKGASEQASSLEEITASVSQINSQSKLNAENAINANKMVKDTMSSAREGNEKMQELVTAMKDINNSTEGINKIAKTIEDIAFQINLLALNANVEAARAGKYGKGFAVVAEEVRRLANSSGESVKEASALVEKALENILHGNKLVETTAKKIQEIVETASKVSDIAEEVTAASKEQTIGLDQINIGLDQIDRVTQNNAASAEESAAAANELEGQAVILKNLISKFKLIETANQIKNSVTKHHIKIDTNQEQYQIPANNKLIDVQDIETLYAE